MKIFIRTMLILFLMAGCGGHQPYEQFSEADLIYHSNDRQLVDSLLEQFKEERKSAPGDLMLKVAQALIDTPYEAHTLENGKAEKMVVNLRGVDCTTYVETCLALTKTIQSKRPSFETFAGHLQTIRYRSGVRDGYLSRLHYFSDWIFDNHQRGNVEDVSRSIAHILYPNLVNFMSTHPQSYQVLRDHPELIEELETQETAISERMAWYIPKNQLSQWEKSLQDGDIVAITTMIAGLDVTHTGLVVWIEGRVHLLHASSVDMKVVISPNTLEEYLNAGRNIAGIMVARPL